MIATSSGRGRLLVVDGDAEARTRLADPLRRAGYQLAEAEDGDDALHRLAERTTDLVFFVQRTAGSEGIEFLIAARDRDPEVPVVILSSERGNVRDAVESCKKGVWDYLELPVGDVDLLAVVRQALQSETPAAAGISHRAWI